MSSARDLEGVSTTFPEFSRVYGRGLDGRIWGGEVMAVGCSTEECAQLAGTLVQDQRTAIKTALRRLSPIRRIMGKLSRVAGTGMCGCNPVRWYLEVHQLVHTAHDNHVRVEQDNSLEQHGQSLQQQRTKCATHLVLVQFECPVDRQCFCFHATTSK